MNDLLEHPAVQAAAIPFIVALILGLLLRRTRFLAAAGVSGVVVVLALTVGLGLDPLTSVKKLAIAAVLATIVALMLEGVSVAPRRAVLVGFAALTGAAPVVVLWRVLQQLEGARPWLVGAAAVVFVVATVGLSLNAGRASSLRGAVIGAALGWGSGVLALLGASALLGQIGLAVGTASAAIVLVQMLSGRESPLGWTLVVPAALTATLVAVLASATGELPWFTLLPLPFVAIAAGWSPIAATRPVWQRALVTGAIAAVPAAVAVGLAWWAAAHPLAS